MEKNTLIIYGRNAVTEAVKNDENINSVCIQKAAKGFGELISLCKSKGIVVKEVTAERLVAMCLSGEKIGDSQAGIRHGGVAAVLSPVTYLSQDELLLAAKQESALILVLDGIEDPHNLGALIRTAEAAGVTALVIPKRRGAAVTGAVYAASAGAAAYVKIARVTNTVAVLKQLKEQGLWVYGAEADGTPYSDIRRSSGERSVLVIGSEGQGLSRLVRENCDYIVSIPMRGKINSLNASVSGGILMYALSI